jgi:hypothetical protein
MQLHHWLDLVCRRGCIDETDLPWICTETPVCLGEVVPFDACSSMTRLLSETVVLLPIVESVPLRWMVADYGAERLG